MSVPSGPVVSLCKAQGFALAGVCAARASDFGDAWHAWLAAGKHGSMGWLAEHADVRADPGRLLEGARSIVMVGDQYARRGEADEVVEGVGRVARYARGRDYHKVMKKRLFAVADALREQHGGHAFRAFVDTAPIFEREHAVRAGLGWVGKHTLLIHPRIGSYVLLGGIITTLDISPTGDVVEDHCGSCTRCIDACPTGAIESYTVDARRCISDLMIERREPIDPAFHGAVGDWLFGCDICQEVCPHNSARPPGSPIGDVHGAYGPGRPGLDLLDVLGWGSAERTGELSGSAMKRATLDMLRRNAVIAAGNVLRAEEDAALRHRIGEIARDPDEAGMVRDAARAVMERD